MKQIQFKYFTTNTNYQIRGGKISHWKIGYHNYNGSNSSVSNYRTATQTIATGKNFI